MRKFKLDFGIIFLLFLNIQCSNPEIRTPMANKKEKKLTHHGHTRVDHYYWLNERDHPEVLQYLEAENNYADKKLAHTEALQETIFKEMKARIKKQDMSVPYKEKNHYYYRRYVEGSEYPIHCRKLENLESKEEVFLDENILAKGHHYFNISNLDTSPDQKLLAYAQDTVGRRIYTIFIKDLSSNTIIDEIKNVSGVFEWCNDNKTIFYVKSDPQTLRSYQVFKHEIGSKVSNDELIYEENDEVFDTYLEKSKSEKYIFIINSSTLSTEYLLINADDPEKKYQHFLPREEKHEYSLDHLNGKFYIMTNWDAENNRLMTLDENASSYDKSNWNNYISHRKDVLLEDLELFSSFVVLSERKNGLSEIRIIDQNTQAEYYLDFGEQTYTTYVAYNPEVNTQKLRFGYTSLTTPNSIIEHDMVTKEKVLLKQEEVVGPFNSKDYITERLFAKASDGTDIPISIVYKKGFKKDGSMPLLQYGYGSYGYSMDATFSSSRLSLLDRGFAWAICHIRGGEEMGRFWYEDGKFLKKKNTFTDFIACSEFLIKEKYTSRERLFAMGGSAGGMLMGVVANMRPDLYKGIVAVVPFVDVLTTMLDESIPLTTGEYEEWGNPNDKEYYHYMLSYSPYDNVSAQDYPNMMVLAGYHDSQVQYWEPAKWVAKLREMKTDQNLLVLKTNMEAGHSGASGRFNRLKETALEYAFLLDQAGIKK